MATSTQPSRADSDDAMMTTDKQQTKRGRRCSDVTMATRPVFVMACHLFFLFIGLVRPTEGMTVIKRSNRDLQLVSTPHYPWPYPNFTTLTARIELGEGQRMMYLRINVSSLSPRVHGKCTGDRLIIYDEGNPNKSEATWDLCGQENLRMIRKTTVIFYFSIAENPQNYCGFTIVFYSDIYIKRGIAIAATLLFIFIALVIVCVFFAGRMRRQEFTKSTKPWMLHVFPINVQGRTLVTNASAFTFQDDYNIKAVDATSDWVMTRQKGLNYGRRMSMKIQAPVRVELTKEEYEKHEEKAYVMKPARYRPTTPPLTDIELSRLIDSETPPSESSDSSQKPLRIRRQTYFDLGASEDEVEMFAASRSQSTRSEEKKENVVAAPEPVGIPVTIQCPAVDREGKQKLMSKVILRPLLPSERLYAEYIESITPAAGEGDAAPPTTKTKTPDEAAPKPEAKSKQKPKIPLPWFRKKGPAQNARMGHRLKYDRRCCPGAPWRQQDAQASRSFDLSLLDKEQSEVSEGGWRVRGFPIHDLRAVCSDRDVRPYWVDKFRNYQEEFPNEPPVQSPPPLPPSLPTTPPRIRKPKKKRNVPRASKASSGSERPRSGPVTPRSTPGSPEIQKRKRQSTKSPDKKPGTAVAASEIDKRQKRPKKKSTDQGKCEQSGDDESALEPGKSDPEDSQTSARSVAESPQKPKTSDVESPRNSITQDVESPRKPKTSGDESPRNSVTPDTEVVAQPPQGSMTSRHETPEVPVTLPSEPSPTPRPDAEGADGSSAQGAPTVPEITVQPSPSCNDRVWSPTGPPPSVSGLSSSSRDLTEGSAREKSSAQSTPSPKKKGKGKSPKPATHDDTGKKSAKATGAGGKSLKPASPDKSSKKSASMKKGGGKAAKKK